MRDEYHKSGMVMLRRVEPAEIAGVAGHEHQVARQRVVDDLSIRRAGSAHMREVVGFAAGGLGFADERWAQAFVDEESHFSFGSANGMVVLETSRQPAQGCFRGRPRNGCASA